MGIPREEESSTASWSHSCIWTLECMEAASSWSMGSGTWDIVPLLALLTFWPTVVLWTSQHWLVHVCNAQGTCVTNCAAYTPGAMHGIRFPFKYSQHDVLPDPMESTTPRLQLSWDAVHVPETHCSVGVLHNSFAGTNACLHYLAMHCSVGVLHVVYTATEQTYTIQGNSIWPLLKMLEFFLLLIFEKIKLCSMTKNVKIR
jgi:hypothetical protein